MPKALVFAADPRTTIERSGDAITFLPAGDPAAERARVLDLVAALRTLPAIDNDIGREPVEFSDRPGPY